METSGELAALAEEFEKSAKCFDVPALTIRLLTKQ